MVHQHFAKPTEAGGSRGWEMARRLKAAGHVITVIRGGAASNLEVVEGIKIRTVSARYDNRMTLPRRMTSFLTFMLKSVLVTLLSRPNIVYASSTPLSVIVPALAAKIVNGSRIIFEVRDLWPEVPVKLGLIQNPILIRLASVLAALGYRKSDLVVALSPFMADGVRAVCPGANVVTIPNGCDLELFDADDQEDVSVIWESLLVDQDVPVVTYAGGFGILYDIAWSVSLAKELERFGVRLVLIGDGSEMETAKTLATSLGMDPNLHFLGRLSKIEVVSVLKRSDASLSTLREDSVLEGCSLNKVFDSLAAGLPVFSNHEGWQMEEIVEASAGVILPRDTKAAANIVAEKVFSKEWITLTGARAKELGIRKYSRDQQFSELISAIGESAIPLR